VPLVHVSAACGRACEHQQVQYTRGLEGAHLFTVCEVQAQMEAALCALMNCYVWSGQQGLLRRIEQALVLIGTLSIGGAALRSDQVGPTAGVRGFLMGQPGNQMSRSQHVPTPCCEL
jgi:hypothetical protein